MKLTSWTRKLLTAAFLSVAALTGGCDDGTGSQTDDITDIDNSTVERQAIGNCWLYAHASWIESMNLSATGKAFDVSQSYWTYWHWYDQIVKRQVDEIETGGFWTVANDIVLDRGVMPESKFVKQDTQSEMSSRQATALSAINKELKEGTLKTKASRTDRLAVRRAMDKAFGLPASVKGQLTKAFGQDGSKTFRNGGTTFGTSILAPNEFKVRYTAGSSQGGTSKDTTLDVAIKEWRVASYPSWGSESSRRSFQIRVQRALHDRQPRSSSPGTSTSTRWKARARCPARARSTSTTLENAGAPGRQGGHMTVLEDYEADHRRLRRAQGRRHARPDQARGRRSQARRGPRAPSTASSSGGSRTRGARSARRPGQRAGLPRLPRPLPVLPRWADQVLPERRGHQDRRELHRHDGALVQRHPPARILIGSALLPA
jgi:hypothetical protein